MPKKLLTVLVTVATLIVVSGQTLPNYRRDTPVGGAAPDDSRRADGTAQVEIGPVLTGPAWGSYKGNWQGLSVNVGSYPAASLFGSGTVPIVEALAGMVNVPPDSKAYNHAAGVSGYGRTASPTQGGVGVFGWGMMAANGAQSWGANFGVTNCGTPNCIGSSGHSEATLYGVEVDTNIASLPGGGTPTGGARGLYILGASNIKPTSGLTGIELDSPGIGMLPHLHWTAALKSDDGSADVFAEVGAQDERTDVAAASQRIVFRSHSAAGTLHVGTIALESRGGLVLSSSAGTTVLGGALNLSPSGDGAGRRSVEINLVSFDKTGTSRKSALTTDEDGNLIISSDGLVVLEGLRVELRSPVILGTLIVAQHTPASSAEHCVPGQFADDNGYHYWCATKDHWLRVAGVPFP